MRNQRKKRDETVTYLHIPQVLSQAFFSFLLAIALKDCKQ